MSDLADNPAATTAGWVRQQIDRGAGSDPRYVSRYTKATKGQPGYSGGILTAEGHSNVDQATADANALTALNGQRKHVYGGAGATAGTSSTGSGSRTFDE
jgi:hypothetical protein